MAGMTNDKARLAWAGNQYGFKNIVGGIRLQQHAVRLNSQYFAGLHFPQFAQADVVKLTIHFPKVERGRHDVGPRRGGEIRLRGY